MTSYAVFESTENQFRKSFSIKSMRLAATENHFRLTKILHCWPGNHFTLLFYLRMISGKSAKERESHRKKKPTRTKHTRRERERTIGVDRNRDHRTVPISVDRDLARSVDRTIAIWRLRSERLRSQSRRSRSRWLRSHRSQSRSHRENVIIYGFYLCF